MSVLQPNAGLRLPSSLETQLHDFRRRVWAIKSAEAACGALAGVILSFLAVFALDRVTDTPGWARLAIFLVAVSCCAVVPVYLHRWVWGHRRMEQLARLLSRAHPSIGDQMLGIIELVRSESEQARSRALCEAAIHQVADEASRRDFRDAVPNPRHRFWAWMLAAPAAVAVTLAALFPSAATNAWQRFIAPWRPIPRYTFTAVEQLPDRLVVAHGEPVAITVHLLDESRWQPATGSGQLGSQVPVTAALQDGHYDYALPPQIDAAWLRLRIGDARQRVHVEPMLRPELSGVAADVQLPEYLKRPRPLHKDVRGGTISLVSGSVAAFTATANRELSSAAVDGQPATPAGALVSSAPAKIDASRKLAFEWKDEFGLAGQEPFVISITAREDEAPSLAIEDLPRQRVVLDSETLAFKVRAQDDFGVKVVGVEWRGIDAGAVAKPAQGERVLSAGAADKETLELAGTFCAQTLGIEAQPLNVRIFAEDYLPGRARVYSPTYLLYVLTAEQHYIWITEQLSKWHRQSLEVRDREMQLHHTNQQLRMLSPEELDRPETRRQIEAQSTAERANGRRLTGLVSGGEELVRQAMRNPEFGVGHLEKWAEMLQILKDISANRMPTVADLLKESSQAPGIAANAPTKPTPMAGQVRDAGGTPAKPGDSKPKPAVPRVVDAESSQQPKKEDGEPQEANKNASQPKLRLPVTTIASSGPNKKQSPTPAAEKLDEAVKAQQDLLAEFEKIADELNKVLANLEGSTLVKRLKAAARQQYVVAGKIIDQVNSAFGQHGKVSAPQAEALTELAGVEAKSSLNVSTIMDDMQSYFERRRFQRFKTVLDEMREQDAVGSLRQLSDDVRVETGMSIAQCEFWSDTFDRWADDLVDPACQGKCPGCKSKGSLPPSIVLEAMKILEAEVNLREETRVAEQARAALPTEEYGERAGGLRETQEGLSERVDKLTVRIRELPDGEEDFAKEIALLGRVEMVMDEAADILGRPDTGSQAIAAETEAIELLLQSKRINPRGGGGGGSSPGGGGSGTTSDAALALVGSGLNDKEVREDRGVSQTTGETGSTLPEEFRAGLDEYFSRLERGTN
ncbi:MAG: hypothetical protein HYX69_03710 [Planctomycetia bacterium]|nr:hypothetical protein [Planctomycetia bacterium]